MVKMVKQMLEFWKINKHSNHPPTITSNIPAAVNKSSISSNDAVFQAEVNDYQEALAASGFDLNLNFEAGTK